MSRHILLSSWEEAKATLNDQRFCLLQRNGPTVFQVAAEDVYSHGSDSLPDTENRIAEKVTIGSPHTCTCAQHEKQSGFCVHLLFVLLKVLKIPDSSIYAKKMQFTDSEIDMILSGGLHPAPKRDKPQRIKKNPTTIEGGGVPESKVERQVLNEDDMCPICQDDMKTDEGITWCRTGCGNNIHAKCMKMYAQFKISKKELVMCPLCREDWGSNVIQIVLNDLAAAENKNRKKCTKVSCLTCKGIITNEFFRCFECSMLAKTPIDFCRICFPSIGREHNKHNFLKSDASSFLTEYTLIPVKNPRTSDGTKFRQANFATMAIGITFESTHCSSSFEQVLSNYFVATSQLNVSMSCWCCADDNSTVNSGKRNINKAIQLPCSHHVHEDCLKEQIRTALEKGCHVLDSIKCQNAACANQGSLFCGLSRRIRKRDSKLTPGINEETRKPPTSFQPLFFSFNISGQGLELGKPNDTQVGDLNPPAVVNTQPNKATMTRDFLSNRINEMKSFDNSSSNHFSLLVDRKNKAALTSKRLARGLSLNNSLRKPSAELYGPLITPMFPDARPLNEMSSICFSQKLHTVGGNGQHTMKRIPSNSTLVQRQESQGNNNHLVELSDGLDLLVTNGHGIFRQSVSENSTRRDNQN